MPAINWLAVVAAALSMFVLGAVWYSPVLFVKQWAKAAAVGNVPRSPARSTSLLTMDVVPAQDVFVVARILTRSSKTSGARRSRPNASSGARSNGGHRCATTVTCRSPSRRASAPG